MWEVAGSRLCFPQLIGHVAQNGAWGLWVSRCAGANSENKGAGLTEWLGPQRILGGGCESAVTCRCPFSGHCYPGCPLNLWSQKIKCCGIKIISGTAQYSSGSTASCVNWPKIHSFTCQGPSSSADTRQWGGSSETPVILPLPWEPPCVVWGPEFWCFVSQVPESGCVQALGIGVDVVSVHLLPPPSSFVISEGPSFLQVPVSVAVKWG